MLQMKFDYDRPAGLRDINVWKCERTHARTDWRTPARFPSYKLIPSLRLWWAKNEGARVVTTIFINFSDAQGQITPKSVMESCRNSNSSELLWLVLLSARVKKIHLKMKVLEYISPIISLLVFFQTLKGSWLISPWSNLAEFRTHARFYSCPRYMQE